MENKMMRGIVTEVLNEINAPKQIPNFESLRTLADLLKFILTRNYMNVNVWCVVFVHEQAHDFRLLYTIIESSQNIQCY
jgi:hypothetical protein